MDRAVEKSGHRKVFRQVRQLLAKLDLLPCRSTFFVRPQDWVIEFVHIHKFTFGPGYRIHLGIRVRNDDRDHIALNGPHSDPYRCPNSPNGSRYFLHYGWDEWTIQKCAEEIYRWCVDVGEPWFERFRNPRVLLKDSSSPLDESEKQRLKLALAGKADAPCLLASEKLLRC
jgi:hypothetical protein